MVIYVQTLNDIEVKYERFVVYSGNVLLYLNGYAYRPVATRAQACNVINQKAFSSQTFRAFTHLIPE